MAEPSRLNQHPLALGSAGGGLVSALLFLLQDSANQRFDFDCVCPLVGATFSIGGIDFEVKSLIAGVVIGYFLGPVLEVLVYLRQLWSLQLRGRVPQASGVSRSYKVLE